jgi:carboxypeptidase PM20D1
MVSNMRINPADSVKSALEYLKKTIGDDSVEVSILEATEPSRVSETACEQWDRVASAVASTWKGCVVSPYLMVQCSDSRHYGRITDKVYRFSAMDLTTEERATIHGHNERIRVETVKKCIEFYLRLIKQC